MHLKDNIRQIQERFKLRISLGRGTCIHSVGVSLAHIDCGWPRDGIYGIPVLRNEVFDVQFPRNGGAYRSHTVSCNADVIGPSRVISRGRSGDNDGIIEINAASGTERYYTGSAPRLEVYISVKAIPDESPGNIRHRCTTCIADAGSYLKSIGTGVHVIAIKTNHIPRGWRNSQSGIRILHSPESEEEHQ